MGSEMCIRDRYVVEPASSMCGSVIRGRARCSYDVLSTLTRRHTSHSSLTLFLAHVNVATRDDWIGCKGGTLRSSDDCGRSAADEASPTAAAVASTLLPNRFFTGAELAAPRAPPRERLCSKATLGDPPVLAALLASSC